MFGQSLLSAFGIACTTDTDQLFATNQSVTSTATYQLNNATTSIPSNTYPGTASNITYTTGKFGDAAVFNGSSSVIDVSSSAINVGTPYTISMWLNFSDVTAYKGVFANITSSRLTNEIAVVLNNGKITIYSVVSNGNTSLDAINATPQSAIANNTWYNVVIVADRSLANKAKVYFNSVETSYTYSAGVASTAAYSDTKIGLADGQYFDGLIDQVRFFASSLPQAAITALYNETTTTATSASVDYQLANPNSIAYYKMSNATDQINNYNFTAYNVNFNVEGKFGFAGEFSGSTSSYMTRSNSFLPTGNASRSFSFWTKLDTHTNDAYFMSYGNGATGQFFSPRVTPVSQGGYISFMGFGADLNSNVVMTTGEWMHLCYTYDGTTLKIYKNAIEIASGNLTLNTSQTRPFIMGARDFNASITKPIDGLIDQVRIYDSAISAADVTTLYNEVECSPAAINALDQFNTVIYTGDGGPQSINTVGFQPDFVWLKDRDTSGNSHRLVDSVRLATKALISNGNFSELTETTGLTSFDSNGFTLGTNNAYTNNTKKYVAWCWYAPTSENIGASGSRVASTVKKNVAAGFSIVSFTCPSSNQNFQIGHGLGVKPDMVIMKKRNAVGVWLTWHKDLSVESYYLQLNSALGESGITQDDRIWGQQSFTSTTISSSTGYSYDVNDTVVAYCFAEIPGYSKIGSYIGNGTSQSLYTGFAVKFVLIKSITSSQNWMIYDSTRGGNKYLIADSAGAEGTSGSNLVTFNSNGFSVSNSNSENQSGQTFIFLAIA